MGSFKKAIMKTPHVILGAISLLLVTLSTQAATHYVDLNSADSTPPYADWSTAATNIQDAVDAATDGDLILVTNGVYATGGRVVYGSLTNRVVIDKAVTVQSINGPAVTMIQGYQVPGTTNGDSAVRCIYLTNSAVLIGFTLTKGATRLAYADEDHEASGGGIWCEDTSAVISNCVLSANAADYTYGVGGGAFSGTFNECTFSDNSAAAGGGAYNGIMNNCFFIDNAGSDNGGSVRLCTLNYCILTGNSALGLGAASSSTLNYCIVTNNSSSGNGGGIGVVS
jgi:hypothetical protein